MSTPAIRLLDSAAGIVVLLLLLIAVVGGQLSMYVQSAGVGDAESRPEIQVSESPNVRQGSEKSQYIRSVEFVAPASDFLRDIRQRETDDDRPAIIAD